jgi:hypothetical protein
MTSMIQNERNLKFLAILSVLDAELLSRCNFLFGGGTRIVLELDEYRESRGIVFHCADPEGFGDLRFAVSSLGHAALFDSEARKGLHFPSGIRFDQSGIRFPVELDGRVIPIALIREPRIDLHPAVRLDGCPVGCLSIADCFAEKLLANSDRGAERESLSRDLIDLGALRQRFGPVPEEVWERIAGAYGAAGRHDLLKALLAFLGNEADQRRCFEGLGVDAPEDALAGISQLLMDLEAPSQAS